MTCSMTGLALPFSGTWFLSVEMRGEFRGSPSPLEGHHHPKSGRSKVRILGAVSSAPSEYCTPLLASEWTRDSVLMTPQGADDSSSTPLPTKGTRLYLELGTRPWTTCPLGTWGLRPQTACLTHLSGHTCRSKETARSPHHPRCAGPLSTPKTGCCLDKTHDCRRWDDFQIKGQTYWKEYLKQTRSYDFLSINDKKILSENIQYGQGAEKDTCWSNLNGHRPP